MNLSEQIEAIRIRTDDRSAPYLWSDDEITLNLNQADSEAAERAMLIQDAVEIVVAAGFADYDLKALRIDRATLESTGDLVVVTSREELDALWSGWETATGTPQYLIDSDDGTVTIVPTPTVDDTLTLRIRRLPSTPMVNDYDTPEIPERYHYRMLDWALHLAYMKHDAETFDQQAADRYAAMFERSFGYRHDANVQRKHRDRKPNTIKSGW